MKTARDQLDIITAYHELGSYRAAAALCGTTHRTVRRVVERRSRPPADRPPRAKSTDAVGDLIAAKLTATDGRISAKRLLPMCRAAGIVRGRQRTYKTQSCGEERRLVRHRALTAFASDPIITLCRK